MADKAASPVSWDGDTYERYNDLHGAMRAFVFSMREEAISVATDPEYIIDVWIELGGAVKEFHDYLAERSERDITDSAVQP